MVEIEQKFRVGETTRLRQALTEMKATPGRRATQRDTYFNHPSRDFATTDEALRLRANDGEAVLTYKGPREPGAVKIRRELELPVTSPDQWNELLELLGFRPVAEVAKERESWHLPRDMMHVEVCCDSVEGLGEFVEIEVLAEPVDIAEARGLVLELAEAFGLTAPEPRSYLELVLEIRKGR